MNTQLEAQVRRLRGYVALQSLLLVALLLAGFVRGQQPQKFETIDVERINLRERDGTLRLVISSRDRLPGKIIAGKEYEHQRGTAGLAGLLFYNDEGTENGGLTFSGRSSAGGHVATGTLAFDQYNQDQVVGVQYLDDTGSRSAGFAVWDRPGVPSSAFFEARDSLARMPLGPERDSAAWRLQSVIPPSASRLFIGRNRAKATVLNMSDPQGRVRLRLSVDSLGAPRIEFLNAAGNVTRRF